MHVKEKIHLGLDGLIKEGPITIVAFGDSITQGCFADCEHDYEAVYWNRLRKKLQEVRDFVPVNVINAGIGGLTAKNSLPRLEKQVLCHNPDLVIVCFGLNDVNEDLNDYLSSLGIIFKKITETQSDVIFMTPNMLNTSVSPKTNPLNVEYARKTSEMQNGGKMDLYMDSAINLAKSMGVAVCDCYGEWKKLSRTCDVTELLANGINHPTKEMHELFAAKLFEIIFAE